MYKLLISLKMLILINGTGMANHHDKIDAILFGKIQAISQDTEIVGQIIQTILPKEAFMAKYGSKWQPMEGQSVEGTKLCKVFQMCQLPDARGAFLRTQGGLSAELAKTQDDTTAVNGLRADSTTSRTGNSSVSASGSETPGRGHQQAGGYYVYNASPAGWNGQVFTAFEGNRKVTVSGSASGGAWSTRTTVNGDEETRPFNLTVNTFIRVD